MPEAKERTERVLALAKINQWVMTADNHELLISRVCLKKN